MGYYKAGKYWEDATLWVAAKGKPIVELGIEELSKMPFCGWNSQTLKDIANEYMAVMSADIRFPILVTTDNIVMDGCHRIVKAILEGKTSIEAIVLDVTSTDFPSPDYDECKAAQSEKPSPH